MQSERRCFMRKRTYYIVRVNCVCSLQHQAHTSFRWMYGPRCRECHRIVGPMHYEIEGTIRATGELDALQRFCRPSGVR
jgi:hypothetical protein